MNPSLAAIITIQGMLSRCWRESLRDLVYLYLRRSRASPQVLKEFYLELRQKAAAVEGAPITTRQLESLVRLTEARAKVELREEASEDDAHDVVDLMRETLLDEFAGGSTLADGGQRGGRSKQVILRHAALSPSVPCNTAMQLPRSAPFEKPSSLLEWWPKMRTFSRAFELMSQQSHQPSSGVSVVHSAALCYHNLPNLNWL